jgi:hypothetical protein
MTSTETFVRKAVEGGWKPRGSELGENWRIKDDEIQYQRIRTSSTGYRYRGLPVAEALLDPSLWRCAGKALGWSREIWGSPFEFEGEKNVLHCEEWRYRWHGLLEHLAEGKDAESYLATLLTDVTETQ